MNFCPAIRKLRSQVAAIVIACVQDIVLRHECASHILFFQIAPFLWLSNQYLVRTRELSKRGMILHQSVPQYYLNSL
jgi:hypothetical protein